MSATDLTNSTSSSVAVASSASSANGTWLWLLFMALINNDVHTNFSRVSWASTLYLSFASIALLIYLGTSITSRLILCWEWRVCPECRRRFPDREQMLHHLRDHHPREVVAHLITMGVRFRNGAGDDNSDCESNDEAAVMTARSKDEASIGRRPTPSDWERCFDVEAGTAYWYNTRTGESSWTEPEDIGTKHNAFLATREPLSRFLKRQRLEKYYGKLRELGAAKAGDLLELDASMIDGLHMKPLEASRFRREVRLMRVGTQPLDLSRVRDWRERENKRAMREASRSGNKRRPVTETQSVIAAGTADDAASVTSGLHPASEPPLGRALSPPLDGCDGNRLSLWRGRGRRVHIAPTDGEESEVSGVASPEGNEFASPVARRLSLPPTTAMSPTAATAWKARRLSLPAATPTSPAAATAWKAGSKNILVCRYDDGPLGLGYKQQKNGDIVVMRVQGQTLDGGVRKGDALVDVSGESIVGKSEMQVMELIEESKRPFTISFRRKPEPPPSSDDHKREGEPEGACGGNSVVNIVNDNEMKVGEEDIEKECASETVGATQNTVVFAVEDDDMVKNAGEDMSCDVPDSIADAEAAALVEQELELREQGKGENVLDGSQCSTRTTKWLELDEEVAEARAEHELQMGNYLSDEKEDSAKIFTRGNTQGQHDGAEAGSGTTFKAQAGDLPGIGHDAQAESAAEVAAEIETSATAEANEIIDIGDTEKAESKAADDQLPSISPSIIGNAKSIVPGSDGPVKPAPPCPRLPPPTVPKSHKPKPPAPAHSLDGRRENGNNEPDNTSIDALQDAIQRTIAAFAPLSLERPKLSKKLLARPPFRFVHDLFCATVKATGFCDGLLEEDERDARAFSGRAAKARFIGKLAHVVGACHDGGFECSMIVPLQVITGREPQDTNLLLRSFADCAVAAKAARAEANDEESNSAEGKGRAQATLERAHKAVAEALCILQSKSSEHPAPPVPTEI